MSINATAAINLVYIHDGRESLLQRVFYFTNKFHLVTC